MDEEIEFIPEPEEPEPVQYVAQIELSPQLWAEMEVFVYFNRKYLVV